ncbi:MAG: LacI family transcriptional regulator [Phycisphaerales bacterium]|nr:LacI family transcriptional regulator [Phycisphaerales bacterium]
MTPRVMAGLDQAADDVGLTVELLGLRHEDVASITRRLERSRPDVLASLAALPRDALLLRDAMRLDIPTLVVGTTHQFLGLPAVVEDNVQGMNLAMDLLRNAGHERIGLLINRWPSPWVFQRQEAFEKRMLLEGLDPNLIGTCWIGSANHPGYHSEPDGLNTLPRRSLMGGSAFSETLPLDGADKTVIRWLKQTQPTAIVTASYVAMETLGDAIGQLGISIPRDLSVVGLDQHPLASQWLGVEPTLAELPLEAIGRQVAYTSRALADGAELPEVVRIPFQMRQGRSIAVVESNTNVRQSVARQGSIST